MRDGKLALEPRRQLTRSTGPDRSDIGWGNRLTWPAQLLLLVFVLVPTIVVVWLSFTDWQPTDRTPWYQAGWNGWDNFVELAGDQRFLGAVLRTLAIVVVSTAVELGLAVLLALLFLEEWAWKKFAVTVLLLPMMIVPVDAANAFFMLFNEHGPVNQIIGWIMQRPFQFAWLANPQWALTPILLVEIWQWTPLMFLLVLTAFLGVSRTQWRAALALGASPFYAFRRIILPLSLPLLTVAVLIRSIETFKIFDAIYILTRGGPGAATESVSMFMYNGGFVYFRMAYIAAAALLVLLLVISLCLAVQKPLLERHG